jgi:hypothetical protein
MVLEGARGMKPESVICPVCGNDLAFRTIGRNPNGAAKREGLVSTKGDELPEHLFYQAHLGHEKQAWDARMEWLRSRELTSCTFFGFWGCAVEMLDLRGIEAEGMPQEMKDGEYEVHRKLSVYTATFPWASVVGLRPMWFVDWKRCERILIAARDNEAVRPSIEACLKRYQDRFGSWPDDEEPMIVALEKAVGMVRKNDWRSVLREFDPRLEFQTLDDAVAQLRFKVAECNNRHSNAFGDRAHYATGIDLAVTEAAYAVARMAQSGREEFPYPPSREGLMMDVWAAFVCYRNEIENGNR